MDEVQLSDQGIIFANHFAPSSISPGGAVLWDQVCEVDPNAGLAKLRLETSEVFFVRSEAERGAAVDLLHIWSTHTP